MSAKKKAASEGQIDVTLGPKAPHAESRSWPELTAKPTWTRARPTPRSAA